MFSSILYCCRRCCTMQSRSRRLPLKDPVNKRWTKVKMVNVLPLTKQSYLDGTRYRRGIYHHKNVMNELNDKCRGVDCKQLSQQLDFLKQSYRLPRTQTHTILSTFYDNFKLIVVIQKWCFVVSLAQMSNHRQSLFANSIIIYLVNWWINFAVLLSCQPTTAKHAACNWQFPKWNTSAAINQ